MSKSQADEMLQEVRNRNHENKIRYRKRVQEDAESEEYMQEAIKRMERGESE